MIILKPNIEFKAVQFKDDIESIHSICELFPNSTISVDYQHKENPILSIRLDGHKFKRLRVTDWIIKCPFSDNFVNSIVMSNEKFNNFFNTDEE